MPGPIGPEEIRRVAEAAFDTPGADGVEVVCIHQWGGLTRFAHSSIHQSTWREDTGIRVRAVTDGRQGVVASNELTVEGARAAARSALEMARVSTSDSLFPGLAPAAEQAQRAGAFDDVTANASPAERAGRVAALVRAVGDGFHAAGALDTDAIELAVATSEGQFCYSAATQSTLATVVSGGDGSAGTAEMAAGRLDDIDPEAAGRTAFAKARDSQGPRAIEPGRYEVVLEPLAVTTLLAFLSYMGFGGRAIAEGRSPFAGKEGQRVCGENVSIYDDALSADTLGFPFDFEGTPKRRVDIIERGVFRTGVHDRRSAKQAGVASTGHALPAPNPDGAFPLNLFLATGDATVEDMIRSTRRGLLVTRFHYSNVVNPMDTTLTGMTRDGTWLIEDGEIRHPVRNLRFTQSILGALSNVELVGRESVIASEFFFAASRVPALKISSFGFSGASDH